MSNTPKFTVLDAEGDKGGLTFYDLEVGELFRHAVGGGCGYYKPAVKMQNKTWVYLGECGVEVGSDWPVERLTLEAATFRRVKEGCGGS